MEKKFYKTIDKIVKKYIMEGEQCPQKVEDVFTREKCSRQKSRQNNGFSKHITACKNVTLPGTRDWQTCSR